jgi:hypothetical protein
VDGVEIFIIGETLIIGACVHAGVSKEKGLESWLGEILRQGERGLNRLKKSPLL